MTGKVLRFIRDRKLLATGDSVLLAVSGGADSVALLLLFKQKLMRPLRLKLGVAHFNHGLRKRESDKDAAFVENLSRGLDLPFYGEKHIVKPVRGESPEEACRRLRYAFLEKTAKAHGYRKIATAHHADDQAETVLMRLLTGTGLAGLAGIRAKNRTLIRPLLAVTRVEITDYLQANRQSFRIDKSNADTHFLRNRIRHRLLPLLKKEFGAHIIATLGRFAQNAAEDFEVTPESASALLNIVVFEKTADAIRFDRAALSGLPGILFRPVLEMALKELGASRISARHFDSLRALLDSDTPASCELPNRLMALRTDTSLDIRKGNPPEAAPAHLPSCTIETLLRQGNLSFPAEDAATAFLDADKLKGKILVRFRKNGDRFHPLGSKGGMKLQDFFVNRKIPREMRDRIPLVCCGNRIVWVVGHRISELAKVTATTRKIAIIRSAN